MLEFQEVGVLDRNSEALGVPTSSLMENAGAAVSEFIIKNIIESGNFKKSEPEIVIFCGPGNNGGDGYVAGRYLKGRSKPKIITTVAPDKIRTDLARSNFDRISPDTDIITEPDRDDTAKIIEGSDIIVDAMLGVGISGDMREPISTYIDLINGSGKVVVSVDAPTGIGTNKAIKPDHTLTFHDIKTGMDSSNSGEITVVPIGIPDEAQLYIGPGELEVYYKFPVDDSHKGQNGKLLIVGGGPYTGAPALAGLAALRTGVDLVHIASNKKAGEIISGFSPDLIVHHLGGSEANYITEDDCSEILKLSKLCDACLIGPGMGRNESTMNAVKNLLGSMNIPVILDADGLSALDSHQTESENRPRAGWIITPHLNEFEKLRSKLIEKVDVDSDDGSHQSPSPGSGLERQCKELSELLGAVIVLKGKVDLVCDSKQLKYNRTGNPGMTVGGTGDVLAGIISGLSAKGLSLYNSARVGTFLNGSAGDLVWSHLGPGLIASDIIEAIPSILRQYIKF